MSERKRRKLSTDIGVVGKETILPTPDKSADPPQPQGKTYLKDSKGSRGKG